MTRPATRYLDALVRAAGLAGERTAPGADARPRLRSRFEPDDAGPAGVTPDPDPDRVVPRLAQVAVTHGEEVTSLTEVSRVAPSHPEPLRPAVALPEDTPPARQDASVVRDEPRPAPPCPTDGPADAPVTTVTPPAPVATAPAETRRRTAAAPTVLSPPTPRLADDPAPVPDPAAAPALTPVRPPEDSPARWSGPPAPEHAFPTPAQVPGPAPIPPEPVVPTPIRSEPARQGPARPGPARSAPVVIEIGRLEVRLAPDPPPAPIPTPAPPPTGPTLAEYLSGTSTGPSA
ncbi:hypothetical protein PHK61_28810 [Actinomycetospora lutea]|uniref:hypothetical protein n=1 Tax=Actinomycetospora lutea TaxID=663604 RepID=UPI002365BBBF|nr:hypothetical protein [Actinomycetospora lutea]MDD7942423.1 hypothetical protein [Actinomycetospora lutea]